MDAPRDAQPAPPGRSAPGAALLGLLVFLTGEAIILLNSGLAVPDLLPERISTYAADVDLVFYVVLAAVGVFFLLTEGLLIHFLVRSRARDGGEDRPARGRRALGFAWTFLPGAVLLALAVFQSGTWGAVRFRGGMPDEADEDVEVICVFAKQFEWHFRYRGPDGRFGTADDILKVAEMHAPVGRPVVLLLQTRDVVHGFWLPNARLKQDVLPGTTIKQWFQLTKEGRWPIVCAVLCGDSHTRMQATLVAQSETDYRAWLAAQAAASPGIPPAEHPLWRAWRESR